MTQSRSTLVRIVLFTAVVLAIVVNFWIARQKVSVASSVARSWQPVPDNVPEEGFAFNDTNGKIPGNPDQTIADMHRLYANMLTYQKRHGRLPIGDVSPSLFEDRVKHSKEYGYTDATSAARSFRNVDMRFDDFEHNSANPENIFPYRSSSIRPNGKSISTAKEPGTRDVLAFTSMYFHRNAKMYPDGKNTTNPVGFYLVLWEDGEVARIPHDQVRYSHPQRAPFPEWFPGQSGKPDESLFTYDEAVKNTLPLNRDGSNPNVSPEELRRSTDGQKRSSKK